MSARIGEGLSVAHVLASLAAWRLVHGDLLEVLPWIPDDTFDSCVCDPPYHLTQLSRNGSPRTLNPELPHGRHAIGSKGFMGKTWDGGDVAMQPETWRAIYRVMKPGAHLVVFGGTRTVHRIACAIQDAGFEIRDRTLSIQGAPPTELAWIYGSGFPKSLNVSKAMDEADFENWLKIHPAEAAFLDRVAERAKELKKAKRARRAQKLKKRAGDMMRRRAGLLREVVRSYTASGNAGTPTDEKGGTYVVGAENSDPIELDVTKGATERSRKWDGWGTALKPSYEPIILARKPLEGTVIDGVEQHGTGAINVDACRVGTAKEAPHSSPAKGGPFVDGGWSGDTEDASGLDPSVGRWPPNLVFTHDARCVCRGTTEVPANPTWDTPNRQTEPSAFTGSDVSKVRHANGRDGEPSADRRYDDKGSTNFAPTPGARRDDTESVDVWECVEGCPVRELAKQSGEGVGDHGGRGLSGRLGYHGGSEGAILDKPPSSGSAARFFPQFEWTELDDVTPFLYCPKANRKERDKGCAHFRPRSSKEEELDGARNPHPTIKPIKLLRWLIRLVTPPGGLVLTPFAGAASEGVAAILEGFRWIGIELLDTDEEPHVSIGKARLHYVEGLEFVPRESLRTPKPPAQRSLFSMEVSS